MNAWMDGWIVRVIHRHTATRERPRDAETRTARDMDGA